MLSPNIAMKIVYGLFVDLTPKNLKVGSNLFETDKRASRKKDILKLLAKIRLILIGTQTTCKRREIVI